VLTHHHHQQQQQHLSHLDRVGIVFQKYRVRFQKPQEWENPKGNPNRIKYQSYTGVWVNYTVKKPKKSWFWCGFGGWGLNCHFHPTAMIWNYSPYRIGPTCAWSLSVLFALWITNISQNNGLQIINLGYIISYCIHVPVGVVLTASRNHLKLSCFLSIRVDGQQHVPDLANSLRTFW